MLPSRRQTYASFGSVLENDPIVRAMESAFDDGLAMAQEGRKLSLGHVPQLLRQSFKRGYNSLVEDPDDVPDDMDYPQF